ncbi:CHAT domain-containing protein [Scytonema sp. UIC 10036]|nr:CHAT domain-containing protein [Scytonema sp. UIC 10036]
MRLYLLPSLKSCLEPELRKAVKRGLQLAIFNSCDGFGIARQLAEFHLPNIIVMREPVPDEVAQKFLQRFLEAFAAGKPLHLAVRRAREKINRLESKFPGATWLPMTFQNPAEPPLTWQALGTVTPP